MPKIKQSRLAIKVPVAYRRYRRLVAIPEQDFEHYRQFLEDQDAHGRIAEAEQDLKAGNYVVASSLREAVEKFRAGTLGVNQ